MSSVAPWAQLVALAERERDLIRDGRWEEVPAVSAERLSAAEALGTPPPAARPYLQKLVELEREIHVGLSSGRAFTLHKLGKLDRGATAVRGYAGGYSRPAASAFNGRA
jgi:hypothetical protein